MDNTKIPPQGALIYVDTAYIYWLKDNLQLAKCYTQNFANIEKL